MSEIRRLRDRLGMTQPALAALLGVTQGTISRWEGERAVPPPGPVALLVELMRPPADWRRVKLLRSKMSNVQDDSWEHVGLYRLPDGSFRLGGCGGRESAWGRTHGPVVWHQEAVTPQMAQKLVDFGGAG